MYDSDPAGKLWRISLGIDRGNTLFVIGLNPSKATDRRSDRTITRIKEYACWHGFDGFIMHNLSAQRTQYPFRLLKKQDADLHRQNMQAIYDSLHKHASPHILVIWGENIQLRPYLKDALREILNLTANMNANWLHIGQNLTRSGHPIHPSRGAYLPLYHFNIEEYTRMKLQ